MLSPFLLFSDQCIARELTSCYLDEYCVIFYTVLTRIKVRACEQNKRGMDNFLTVLLFMYVFIMLSYSPSPAYMFHLYI